MNKVYSIVVLYNPEASSLLNINKIVELSEKTFVIINSCSQELLNEIKKLNVYVIDNFENLGLSKALNIGIKKCIEEGVCTHISLYDQDSMPATDSLEILLQTLLESSGKIAAIGPSIDDIKNKGNAHNVVNSVSEVDVIISSGSLIPIAAIKDVGLMDETLFIDYIDYEWCLRAKSKGYKILQNSNALLYHNMGDSFVNFFGFSKPLHTNKLRHYYIIRNQLILLNRDYVSLKWKCIHIFKLFYRIPSYIFLSDDKPQTFKFIANAIKDFILNKKAYKSLKY